ncbi:MAG TPA: hypothetical protein VGQ47_02755 [Candidatus Limnocylindrales bacterium]|nr:hypothetical protein [Candidatus Limnocylindrales bacterium]
MNQRRERLLLVGGLVLAAILAIAGGYFVGFVLTRPPEATPSPTLIAASPTERPTPSPSSSPTPSPTPSPSATPSPSPSPSPSASPVSSATPTGTPSPTPPPASPIAVSFRQVGLDASDDPDEQSRTITFATNARGEVLAGIAGTTGGTVQLCLTEGLPGAPVGIPICQEGETLTIRGQALGPRTQWTVTLAGLDRGARPVTNLTIRFPSNRAGLELSGFEFQGTDVPAYDGFTVDLPARATGELTLAARWHDADGSDSHDYQLTVTDLTDAGAVPFERRGTDTGLSATVPFLGGHTYRVHLGNGSGSISTRVTLEAELSWP